MDVRQVTIGVDPLRSLSGQTELRFEPMRAEVVISGRREALADWTILHGAVLSMHIRTASTDEIHGSAAIVAPGIALTAWHVVADYIGELRAGRGSIVCTGFAATNDLAWRVVRLAQIELTDVCVLILELSSPLPTDGTFRQAVISTRVPEVGELVALVGFHSDGVETNPSTQTVRAAGNFLVSTGAVSDVFPTGRPGVGLCFHVDCETLGGMSGGPVFDRRGLMVGVVSKGMTLPEMSGYSVASLVWPAMAAPISPVWPPGILPTTTTLLDLGRSACFIERPDAVVVEEIAPSGVRIRCLPWQYDTDPNAK